MQVTTPDTTCAMTTARRLTLIALTGLLTVAITSCEDQPAPIVPAGDGERPAQHNQSVELELTAPLFAPIAAPLLDPKPASKPTPEPASKPASKPSPKLADSARPRDLAMTTTAGDDDHRQTYVILATDSKDAWFRQMPIFLGYEAARVGVHSKALTQGLRSWNHRQIELFDQRGDACSASVTTLWGLTQSIPAVVQREIWAGEMSLDDSPPEALSKPELAKRVWDPYGQHLLVGQVAHPSGGCDLDKLVWAKPKDAGPTLLDTVELAERDQNRLVAAFGREPRYADIQRRLDERDDTTADTWTDLPGGSPEIQAFRAPSGQIYAVVSVSVGSGCGDFSADMSAMYELQSTDQKPASIRRLSSDQAPYIRPQAAVSTGDDTPPTFIGQNRAGIRSFLLAAPVEHTYRLVEDYTIPFLECGC